MSLVIPEVSPISCSGVRNPEVEKLLYGKREAAIALSISVRSVDYLLARKELAFRRIGGRVLIPRSELLRFARADHPEPLTSPSR